MFRKYIKGKVCRYQNAVLQGKETLMVKSLVSELQKKGCRFLLRSFSGTWVHASSRQIEKEVNGALGDALVEANNGVSCGDFDTLSSYVHPPLLQNKTSTDQARPMQRLTKYNRQRLGLRDHDGVAANSSDIDHDRAMYQQERYSCILHPTSRQVDNLTSVSAQDEHVVAALGIILGICQQADEC